MHSNFFNIVLWLTIFIQIQTSTAGIFTGTAAALIGTGASLVGTSIQSLSAGGPNRNLVIELTNHLDVPLYGGQHFLQWGWNTRPPQPIIRAMTREAMKFEKVGDTATGTAGIITYQIGDPKDIAKFALVFSIPYNYIHASNWFGVKFIGNEAINKELYDEMYYDPIWKNPKVWAKYGYAYEGKPITIFHNDYIISASMSNQGRSVLKVDVYKKAGAYEANGRFFT